MFTENKCIGCNFWLLFSFVACQKGREDSSIIPNTLIFDKYLVHMWPHPATCFHYSSRSCDAQGRQHHRDANMWNCKDRFCIFQVQHIKSRIFPTRRDARPFMKKTAPLKDIFFRHIEIFFILKFSSWIGHKSSKKSLIALIIANPSLLFYLLSVNSILLLHCVLCYLFCPLIFSPIFFASILTRQKSELWWRKNVAK